MHFTTGELLGSIGVTLLLVAFLMSLLKKWPQESLPYILLNTIGAAMACASSVAIRFIPFIILEGTWTVVSLAALMRYAAARRRQAKVPRKGLNGNRIR